MTSVAVFVREPQDLIEHDGKTAVRYRFDHKVRRVDGIALYGVLDHIGYEHERHGAVDLAQLLRSGHTVEIRHLYIDKNDIVRGIVPFQKLYRIVEFGNGKALVFFTPITLEMPEYFAPVRSVVVHYRNIIHHSLAAI